MDKIRWAKALGRLPGIPLADLDKDTATMALGQNDIDRVTPLIDPNPDEAKLPCAHPDEIDDEIADYDDPEKLARLLGFDLAGSRAKEKKYDVEFAKDLIHTHFKMRESEYNNNRWPKGCNSQFPDKYSLKIFHDWDRVPAHNMQIITDSELRSIADGITFGDLEYVTDVYGGKPMARVARMLADEAYRWVGMHHFYVDTGPNGEHQMHITPRPIPGSVIGIGEFPNGRCNDHVLQQIDTVKFNVHSLARLYAHEDGHCHGEQHQFTNQSRHMSVMSYTRPKDGRFRGFSTGKDPFPSWLPMDRSLPSLKEKYEGTGEPTRKETDPPKPGPPNPPVDDPFVTVHRPGRYKLVYIDDGEPGGGGGWS